MLRAIPQLAGADAAHPSITSLNRHITSMGRGSWAFSANPPPITQINQNELAQTLQLACSAILGVCVAFYEVVGEARPAKRFLRLEMNS
jgi:hypothetical protein